MTPQALNITVGTQTVLLDLETDASPPMGPFWMTTFDKSTGELTLSWSGGTGPFQIQKRGSVVSGTWQNAGAETPATNVSLTVTNSEFFRVSRR